jgi:hypothetical protein
MTDLLQTGIDWLDAQRRASLSRLVTYERGGDSVQIAATLGTSEEEVYDQFGTSMRAKRTDFLITAADLILDTVLTTPEPGDRIVSGTKTYEVMALSDGRHYVALPGDVTLRVHAKLVDE